MFDEIDSSCESDRLRWVAMATSRANGCLPGAYFTIRLFFQSVGRPDRELSGALTDRNSNGEPIKAFYYQEKYGIDGLIKE